MANIGSLDAWFLALVQPPALLELAALAACIGLAWLLTALARQSAGDHDTRSIWFGHQVLDGVMFPLLLLSLAYAARAVLLSYGPITVFRVAIPVLVALAVIRLGVKVLQVAFSHAPLVRALERTISWLVWLAVVLWVSGLLPLILEELDTITWHVGGSKLSVRTLIEGVLTTGLVLIVALWVSSAIETRLLRSATGSDLSLRKAFSNATRALLVFVGLLVALSVVGIDLTALSVRVDGFEGRITDINARYTVIRALNGRESIVPNEMFISNRIENLSLADSHVSLSTVVTVAYDSDLDQVLQLLTQAAAGQQRVLSEPAPSASLSNFGPDGLELTLNFWIADPENGQINVRSQVNLAILKALRAHGVEIPVTPRPAQPHRMSG